MKRSEVRTFIAAGVAALQPSIEFDSGQLTDFNSDRSNVYPKVWLETLEADTEYPTISAPVDTWPIKLYIASKDAMDSAPAQYEALIDQADFIAQKLVYQYRNVTAGYKLIYIENTKRLKWIKKNADCLTGIILEFHIKNTDKTNVCS